MRITTISGWKKYKINESFVDRDINTLRDAILNDLLSSRECKDILQKYKVKIDQERYSPAVLAEKENNLHGISHQYKMPLRLTNEEYENLAEIFMEDKEIIDILFDELLKLNPELHIFKNYPYATGKFMYPTGSVIGGACSQMNVDDIKDYIDNSTEIKLYSKENNGEYIFIRNGVEDKEYSDLYTELYKKNINIQYFPSPKTLKNIIGQTSKSSNEAFAMNVKNINKLNILNESEKDNLEYLSDAICNYLEDNNIKASYEIKTGNSVDIEIGGEIYSIKRENIPPRFTSSGLYFILTSKHIKSKTMTSEELFTWWSSFVSQYENDKIEYKKENRKPNLTNTDDLLYKKVSYISKSGKKEIGEITAIRSENRPNEKLQLFKVNNEWIKFTEIEEIIEEIKNEAFAMNVKNINKLIFDFEITHEGEEDMSDNDFIDLAKDIIADADMTDIIDHKQIDSLASYLDGTWNGHKIGASVEDIFKRLEPNYKNVDIDM